MSTVLRRRLSFVAPIGIVVAVYAVTAAAETSVTVRVYDGGATDAATRIAAIETATAIVADAGISVRWLDCTPGPAGQRRCEPTRGTRDLILRIMPAEPSGSLTTEHALESRVDGNRLILGFAVIEPATGAGALATIFMNRIVALGQRARVASGPLLGRAIAHEVGHLLLGHGRHSASGLMRAVWTDAELAAGHSDDWRFSALDREQLRRLPHDLAPALR